jgi:ABC-type antimicrobial peptide transport system permease subunit
VLTGWTFQFYYPYDVAALSVVASVILCVMAGYGPSKRAAATPIVTAVGYE